MVAQEEQNQQEWLRSECARLRAEAGDDPVAWLRARMDEAEHLQDEHLADDAMHDFDFATFREDDEPASRVPDDVYIQRIRIRSPNGRWDQALGLATEPPPFRLSPKGTPYSYVFTPAEDWDDIHYIRYEWDPDEKAAVSLEELEQLCPDEFVD